MSVDYGVMWGARRPSQDEVRSVVEDFFGGSAVVALRGGDPYVLDITIPCPTSRPLRRLPAAPVAPFGTTVRCMEVWDFEDSLLLTLRCQDEFMYALAAGLAGTFARVWEGRVVG